MLPSVPCKRLAESEEDSDEIWEEVTHQPEEAIQEIILQRPRKRSGITKQDKMQRMRLHQVHLVCLLAAAIIRNKWCNDTEIQGICYSLIPKTISKNRLFKHSIKTFLSLWKNIIKFNESKESSNESDQIDSSSQLAKGLSDRCFYSRNNFNIVFAAACRSMQLNTRLMACLFPISLSLAQEESKDLSLQIWLEVWDDFHQAWLPVDAARNIVDEPLKIIELSQTRKSWGIYVLAFDSTFGIKDVTQKYTDEWGSKVARFRLGGENEREWFFLLSRYSRLWNDSKECAEDEIIRASTVAEKMPTSQKGFLNHPIYALEKQCKKNEVIYPRGVQNSIGRFKNDLVYPRSFVHRALSSDGWIRLGRSVIKDQEPCKILDGTKSSTNCNLYGEWQTVTFESPELGKIPKNSFGNIEIFHPLMVPKGAIHISGYPEAIKVAKKLGLDFSRAVTGFDFYKGKPTPRIEGIVIHQENRGILHSAISEFIQKSLEEESKKRETRVIKLWTRLTVGILNLTKLRERYLT